jgi:hypothetical protein
MSEPDAGHDQLRVLDGAVQSQLEGEHGLGVLVRSCRQHRALPSHQLAMDCVTVGSARTGRERQAGPAMWPFLVVLDVGLFTVRCRSCRWASPGQSALGAALAAFEVHGCEELSA